MTVERKRQKYHKIVKLLGYPMFDNVQSVVFHPALNRAFTQFKKARNSLRPLGLCTNQVEGSIGIPRAHVFNELLTEA